MTNEGNEMSVQETPSLYDRLGGVYNIATVIDDLIDRVMADNRLNANPRVDEAHHRVSSYLSHHHVGDEDPGWVRVVVEYVLALKEPVVLQQAEQAWFYSRKALSRDQAA